MDIHGNIDISDSLNKAKKQANRDESVRFASVAQEYALQGFDEKQVAELLQIDGCSLDVSKDLALSSCHNLPAKYVENENPVTYGDIQNVVEKTLIEGNVDEIQRYFTHHASREFSQVGTRVLVARDNPSRIFIEELHKELRPLIEGIIIDNQILAKNEKQASSQLSEKERLELDLFGVWPVYLLQKQARKKMAEEEIYDKHTNAY